MAHTYTSNLFHIVFSTKECLPAIREPAKLWAYLAGVARNLNYEPLAIGGTENHVHVLLRIPTNATLSEVAQKLKSNSSRWLRQNGRWLRMAGRLWRVLRERIESGGRSDDTSKASRSIIGVVVSRTSSWPCWPSPESRLIVLRFSGEVPSSPRIIVLGDESRPKADTIVAQDVSPGSGFVKSDESGRTAHEPRQHLVRAVRIEVPSLKGLRFISNPYPGLTTGATIVTPCGLRVPHGR